MPYTFWQPWGRKSFHKNPEISSLPRKRTTAREMRRDIIERLGNIGARLRKNEIQGHGNDRDEKLCSTIEQVEIPAFQSPRMIHGAPSWHERTSDKDSAEPSASSRDTVTRSRAREMASEIHILNAFPLPIFSNTVEKVGMKRKEHPNTVPSRYVCPEQILDEKRASPEKKGRLDEKGRWRPRGVWFEDVISERQRERGLAFRRYLVARRERLIRLGPIPFLEGWEYSRRMRYSEWKSIMVERKLARKSAMESMFK